MVRPPTSDSRSPPSHAQCLHGRAGATDYARLLLGSLGVHMAVAEGPDDDEPAISWARSGLMALTGLADGPSLMCPVPLASCADGAMVALRTLASVESDALPAGASLLGERAALAGLHRNGRVSPGGGCRLLRASDGWIAVSLVRDSDWSDVPAWLECDAAHDWNAVGARVALRRTAGLVERARLLGIPACASPARPPASAPWCAVSLHGPPAAAGSEVWSPPRVVDLSSLWAGPLCSHLLLMLGARVVKVESRARPDGARNGPAAFHDLLNAGKRSVSLDFTDAAGIARLQELIDWADVVIEASRPRALRQLGIVAEDCIARRRGLTWVSITGYGRDEPQGLWTAFGDDAGVAAGLSGLLQAVTGQPLICGDAIADPLTGLHAALAAVAGHRNGGGRLVSLALHDVVAHCAAFSLPDAHDALCARWQRWTDLARKGGLDAMPPVARRPAGRAAALGEHDDAPLAGWADVS